MKSEADVQQDAQQSAGSCAGTGADGASASVPSNGPPAPNAVGRDGRGRFLAGHRENLTTGMHTERFPIGLEHLEQQVDQFVAGCLTDEADPDVPTRRRSLLQYRARLHRRIIQLDAALEVRGLLDRRQKLRTNWLQMLAALIERARAIDVTLGLARRQKKVPTPIEWLQSLRDRDDEHGDDQQPVDPNDDPESE